MKDHAHCLFTFPSGAVFTLEMTRCSAYGYDNRIEVRITSDWLDHRDSQAIIRSGKSLAPVVTFTDHKKLQGTGYCCG